MQGIKMLYFSKCTAKVAKPQRKNYVFFLLVTTVESSLSDTNSGWLQLFLSITEEMLNSHFSGLQSESVGYSKKDFAYQFK